MHFSWICSLTSLSTSQPGICQLEECTYKTDVAKMDSKLGFTHLGFSEQGPEAPERSSTNRASTDPLKAVL